MKTVFTAVLASAVFATAAFAAEPTAKAIEDMYTPPLIPHPVAAYLPITPQKNMCVMCHQPAKEGQKKVAGMATPLPPSHVSDGKVALNRYECMLCHAPINKP